MNFFKSDNTQFQAFTGRVEAIIASMDGHAGEDDADIKKDIEKLQELMKNFRTKTDDFFREERKLNIGVVGQVKAGKSSFLNTLLFGGKEVLPKASTPKTATLTKMEYSEENIIQIEYYTEEEWEEQEENAALDLDGDIYTSARELVEMLRRNGLDPQPYLEKETESIHFDTYEDLIESLNDYVGEDGRFTPIVKSVTLFLHNEDFQGLSIVDTPGLNDPIASRTLRTKEFLEICDVVFFLSQSGSFLDKSDWTLLSSQLPQKGVKRLILIASKYDSGVRDVLKIPDEDDIFGEDENTADNIPDACRLIQKKLTRRAKSKVSEFIKDLEMRESSPELIEVVRNCEKPILISSLAYNMAGKAESDFSPEERNIYHALSRFSSDMDADLRLLGNIDAVRPLFADVVAEKEKILEERERSFVPDATEELKNLLDSFIEKTMKRIQILESGDKEQLEKQKERVGSQKDNIRADIISVFGELKARLETEKAEGVRELREKGKDFLDIKEHTGTKTRTGHYTTGHLWWKETHSYSYDEHYTYCLASDAVENLNKYAMDASNEAEEVFTEALQITEVKRKILNVVVENFDMGSEKYDSSLFRIMVEEAVNALEFPVLNLDISGEMNSITGKFAGELTSGNQKTELSVALNNAISKIYEELCKKLSESVKQFKADLDQIAKTVQDNLLKDIMEELEELIRQCDDKEKQIAGYKAYIEILKKERGQL